MARGDSMIPEKRALAFFIHEHLPPLLANNGGKMRKGDARRIIDGEFKKRYGWASVLDHVEPGKNEMSVASNAWGWGTAWLCDDKISVACSGKPNYQLRR